MRRLLAIAAGLAGLACWGQAASGVALIDVEGDGFAFRRLRDAGATPDAGLIVAPAFFAFAPAFRSSAYDAGQGLGAECACADVTTPDGGAFVYTRAGTAYCTKSDYTLVACGADKPRIMPGRPGGPLGYLQEQDGQCDVLRNRDLSNAAWTKSGSMSCAHTATGPDGVGNSASTCTSSGTDQTVLQAVTRASGVNATSVYVKRRTGTGAVSVTRDNGSTWTAITADLTTDWKRVVCVDSEGCMGGRCIIVPDMCATSANPTVGLKIATSGDAVDVDFFQNEAFNVPTSVMASTGSVGTRSMDNAAVTIAAPPSAISSWHIASAGTHVTNSGYALHVTSGGQYLVIRAAATEPLMKSDMSMVCVAYTGGVVTNTVTQWLKLTPGSFAHYGCGLTTTEQAACVGGWCLTAAGSFTAFNVGATVVNIGQIAGFGSAYAWNGVISDVCLDTGSVCRSTRIEPSTANHIVWIGDSLSNGTNSSPVFPTTLLYESYSQLQSRGVSSFAQVGQGSPECLDKWESAKSAGGHSLVLLCGINSIKGGTSAASVWSDLGTILTEAKAAGWSVTPITITPFGAAAEWTAPRQANLESVNASIRTWANTYNGGHYVDAYNSLLRVQDGGVALEPTYDYGDGLHWAAAGATYFTALLVDAGSP